MGYMIMEAEGVIEALFVKLINKEHKFYFVSSILNFLEEPYNYNLLKFANFSHGFTKFMPSLEKIIPLLQAEKQKRKEYRAIFLMGISSILSDYRYVLISKDNVSVQSSLIFMLIKSLSPNCLDDLINYIFEKRITEVIARPQLYNFSFTFSTVMHEIISKGYDELAARVAAKLENKSLLFIKDIDGLTPIELALQNNCPLTFEYITQIKRAGEELPEEDFSYW